MYMSTFALRSVLRQASKLRINTHSDKQIGSLTAALLVLMAQLLVQSVSAQAPGLQWTTNIGARLFAVDARTNVYANAGGTVIQLTSAGVPVQTNAICPVPGIARRDDAGNFY